MRCRDDQKAGEVGQAAREMRRRKARVRVADDRRRAIQETTIPTRRATGRG